MTSMMMGMCRVNNENHKISCYCGGKTAPIPDRKNNNPSRHVQMEPCRRNNRENGVSVRDAYGVIEPEDAPPAPNS